jgi:dipeptidyl aminopeptidase/acylaminoacyl peptidase
MVPEDVYQLTGVADPRVSPDGRTVAFSVWGIDRDLNEYRSAIWLAPADGSGKPVQFTSGAKRDGAPRWSPDGSLLAFVSNRDGKAAQLYVMPSGGGEPRRLSDLKEDASEVVWSPDGSRLAFSSRVQDPAYDEADDRRRRPRRFTRLQYKLDDKGWVGDRRQHVFTVPADGSSAPTQITDGDFEDAGPAWSPDGERLAFVSGRHERWDVDPVRDVYVVDARGGEPSRLTASDGWCESVSWSPDGSRLAVSYTPGVWDDPRHAQVAVVDVDKGGTPRILTSSLDRNCNPYPPMREPVWDGTAIVFAVEDHGNTHVYRVEAGGSKAPDPLVHGDLAVTGFDSVAGRLAYAATTPTAPAELFTDAGPLTDVGAGFRAGRALCAPERFTAISPDGTEVEAWIMRPAGFAEGRRYPMLLNIHGGPFTQYGNRFFDEFQVYTGAGFAVVYSNPRGSSGYDESWGRAIRGPLNEGPGWGTVDYEDLMAVTDEALKRFEFCDPDRLGVLGGSYGGFMTSWIVGHTDRFRAAVSERALNNLISDWGSSDFGWTFKGYVGGFLYEDVEAHLRMSPSSYAHEITTPLLILHSENDLRCPVEQGEHLFTTLRILGREVEMVRFPSESHELSRSGSPAHRVMRFEVILDWFARMLR